ncbi:hypothetical protein CI109_105633 [Kwoniella shandongensis]|uniref:Uncharacterized protein n=1 Tax=Kwoniella shandongensis TaxID=1734106 RepID=A0A5M6C7L9_9TREE|nr:uncharacterized protein CI109_002349 [Kwoniella shandongensis]KAA5529455.1 hypothetical protein CI109_002349 [Kwoniella shandongensis]
MAPHDIPIFDAEVVLECENDLGEGVVWDSKTQLLNWVDIFASNLHSYDPVNRTHSVDHYPESHCLTYITPRASEPGFVATLAGSLVLLPPATPPTSTSAKPTPVTKKSTKTLSEPMDAQDVKDGVTRFNDGGVDPQGRVWYGSMGNNEQAPEMKGELWRYDPDGTETKVLSEIGVSNGTGWSPDGRTMYYIDSRKPLISAFDFDPSSGTLSNRRTFADTPPPLDDSRPAEGVFDGLCVDGVGNIWVARWRDERLVGYRPDGELFAMIRTEGCKSPTIPCFGGKDLTTMYIASATSYRGGPGDKEKWPKCGHLFKIECGPGSELGRVLGEGWKGAERHRAAI